VVTSVHVPGSSAASGSDSGGGGDTASLLTLLLLSDGRFPAGGHAHSGGVEPAVTDGSIHDLATLGAFLRGRLATAGLVAAAFAAASAGTAAEPSTVRLLDDELDARTPSPAVRAASRAQGRALMRAGRAAWPAAAWLSTSPQLGQPADPARPVGTPVSAPHQPIALGLVAAAGGLSADQAARAAVHGLSTGSASAATRLLGLDPLAVAGLLAALAEQAEQVAAAATAAARAAVDPADLPAVNAVRLDLLAERHRAASLRMFAS
jgi:urease accessory protein